MQQRQTPSVARISAWMLGIVAAAAAQLQQGLIVLLLGVCGFLVYALWFWKRVLRSYGTDNKEASAGHRMEARTAPCRRSSHATSGSCNNMAVCEGGNIAGDAEGDEVADDSADDADSEAEKECLVPTAAKKWKLPRRMSFPSANLAAGIFPSSAEVKHYTVSTCLFVTRLPSSSQVLHLIESRLLEFPRFKSIPILSWLYPYWLEVQVDPTQHLDTIRVRNMRDLHLLLEDIMSQPCPAGRPHWKILLIENEAADGSQPESESRKETELWLPSPSQLENIERIGSQIPNRHCIVIRADHSIGDGVSLVEVGLRLLTDSDGRILSTLEKPPILQQSQNVASDHLCLIPTPTALLLRWTKAVLRTPRRLMKVSYLGVMLLLGSFRMVKSVLLSSQDPCTAFTGSADLRRSPLWCSQSRVASATPLPLQTLRALRRAAQVTLNDLFLAALTGAYRRYCELEGDMQFSSGSSENLPQILMACAFFRKTTGLADNSELLLRNRFTLCSLSLPADADCPRERLSSIARATATLKRSHQMLADFICQKMLGLVLPRQLTTKAAEELFKTHSIVFSNLPAYTAPVFFCGCEIMEVNVLYPNLIPQVEIVSYAGRVFFSFIYNQKIVKKGEMIPKLFVEELWTLADAFGIPCPDRKIEQADLCST